MPTLPFSLAKLAALQVMPLELAPLYLARGWQDVPEDVQLLIGSDV